MKIKIAVAVLAVGLGAFVYFMFFAGPGHHHDDPLAQNRKACGNVDPVKGDQLISCLELAYDLMGRADVKVDEDAARALLKRTCDQAYQPGCDALARFEDTKVFVAEGRCDAAWFKPADAHACVAAGQAYQAGGARAPDEAEARQWYAKACALGDHDGCARK